MHATTTFELWRFISICSKFVFPRLHRRTCTDTDFACLSHEMQFHVDLCELDVKIWNNNTERDFFPLLLLFCSDIYVLSLSVVAIIAHGNGFVSQLEIFFFSSEAFQFVRKLFECMQWKMLGFSVFVELTGTNSSD